MVFSLIFCLCNYISKEAYAHNKKSIPIKWNDEDDFEVQFKWSFEREEKKNQLFIRQIKSYDHFDTPMNTSEQKKTLSNFGICVHI